MKCYGDVPKFLRADGSVRPVEVSDVTLPDGTVWVPEGCLVRTEEYDAAPGGGASRVRTLAPGETIRMVSFGDKHQRAIWEVMA